MRRIIYGLLLLTAIIHPARAQLSNPQLNVEIDAQFPDNHAGAITPLKLRSVTHDIVNAIVQQSVSIRSGNNGCAAAVPYDPGAPVDATVAIQCQINYVRTTYGGGVVYVDPGIYLISSGGLFMPANVRLAGAGARVSQLAVLTDSTVVTFAITAGACPVGGHGGGYEYIGVSGYINAGATQPATRIGVNCDVTLREFYSLYGAYGISNDGVDSRIQNGKAWGFTGALTGGGSNWYFRVQFDDPGISGATYGYHQTANIAGLGLPENFFVQCDFSGAYTYSVKIDDTGNTAITHFSQGVFSSPIVITTSRSVMIDNSEIGSTTFTVANGNLLMATSYALNSTTLTGAGTRVCAANGNITC